MSRICRKPVPGTVFATLVASVLWGAFAPPLEAGIFGDPTTYEQVRRFLGRHRADVAVVAYSIRPDGTPDPSDPGIAFHADTPMPLASSVKVVLLAAYARASADGRLDPGLAVPLRDWERFYLPGTDGGAHPAALAALGIPADDYGFALDPGATVPVEALVQAMIRESDNAAADWVLSRLGDEEVAAAIRDGGLTGQERPLSLVGQFLAWANHDRPSMPDDELRRFASDQAAWTDETRRLRAAFEDPAWREAELLWRLNGNDPSTIWSELGPTDLLNPKGTAGDFARMMAGVATGIFISPAVSAIMSRILEWPMALPGFDSVFERFGEKGGSLPGVLTDAQFAVSKVGDFPHRPRVCVLFLRRLPVLAYLSMSQSGAQQVLELGLLGNRNFVASVEETLEGGD